jgi:hypothetical protein
LKAYKGIVNFEILGDSLIVLNQIRKNSYNFQMYAAARIQKIRETTLGLGIQWSHVSSENNLSDILTREYWLPPSQLPWSTPNMTISEESLDMTEIPISSLPDSDKNFFLMAQQTTVEQLSPDGPAHGLSPNSLPQASLARTFKPQNTLKDQKLNTARQEILPDLAQSCFTMKVK